MDDDDGTDVDVVAVVDRTDADKGSVNSRDNIDRRLYNVMLCNIFCDIISSVPSATTTQSRKDNLSCLVLYTLAAHSMLSLEANSLASCKGSH
jgi:hypothetical protein